MKKQGLKWTPAVPLRRPDNIISSKVRENGEKGFIPSYENEPKINMNFIMSHEYLRIWLKERTVYEIDTYSKQDVEAGAGDIKRRFVQRYMSKSRNKGKERILPPIKLKRFAKASSKVDNKRSKNDEKKENKENEKEAVENGA
ncbi:hypothetical protein ILUMI_07200 [Ignelater luminosus]|uniref:Uncharacterized protein n=1 Tax=Ignelater luminosus TaxID=2038154 RepID=A0A8K0D3Y8_IGNLU|nr:hypothetical protein ILUMI_07200 [Ignelater luminosus]